MGRKTLSQDWSFGNTYFIILSGAQITGFFLAFVFGSYCTYCFHVLMYMFDNKCVLYPKLVSHSSIHRMVQELLSMKSEQDEDIILPFAPSLKAEQPPEILSTQWSENSVCYLPTYVPLMSGLCGLVWATMFFMCSGASNVAGQQKHWKALPLIFLFSVSMAGLCIYSSAVTHSGLLELCMKLTEATGGSGSKYTINVATLVHYERRIRGVFQMTRLTIASAWLHTICWVLSALVVIARVLLVVDFTLVSVRAQLMGDLDKLLQKYEDQINSMSPESSTPSRFGIYDSEMELHANKTRSPRSHIQFQIPGSDTSDMEIASVLSLVPEEKYRLTYHFIRVILNELVEDIVEMDSSGSNSLIIKYQRPGDASGMAIEFVADFERRLTQKFIRNLLQRLVKDIVETDSSISSDSSTASDDTIGTAAEPIIPTNPKDEHRLAQNSIRQLLNQLVENIVKTDSNISSTVVHIRGTDDKNDTRMDPRTDICKDVDKKAVIKNSEENINVVDTASVRTLTPLNEKLENYNQNKDLDYVKAANTASERTLTPADNLHFEVKVAVDKVETNKNEQTPELKEGMLEEKKSDEIENGSEDKTKPENENTKTNKDVKEDHKKDDNKPGPSDKNSLD